MEDTGAGGMMRLLQWSQIDGVCAMVRSFRSIRLMDRVMDSTKGSLPAARSEGKTI